MKKVLISLLVLLSAMPATMAVEPPLSNRGRKGLDAKTIDEMLALPDKELDIGLGALLIGKEYDPDLDVPKYLAQLDRMAFELCSLIGDEADPKKILSMLNTYIYRERRFRAVKNDQELLDARFLHCALSQKRGNCLSFSTLYRALGERLGLPLFGVVVPRHSFVRYLTDRGNINIETTQRGQSHWDLFYRLLYRVPKTQDGQGFYMRNLTKRQFLAVLLVALPIEPCNRENLDQAIRRCRQALGIIPHYADGWTNLGAVLHLNGDSDGAIKAYRKALAIRPRCERIWCRLGYLHQEDNNLDEAVAAYNEALQIRSRFAEAWYRLGTVRDRQGHLDEAMAAYRKALAIGPDDAATWHALGTALRRGGRLNEAAEALEKSLAMDPDAPFVWADLAFIYSDQGNHKVAIQTYRRAVRSNPNAWILWNNLSVELAKVGATDEAIEALERSLEVNSVFPVMAAIRLVDLYGGRERMDEATVFFRRNSEKDPEAVWPRIGLALALEEQGKAEEAGRVSGELSKIHEDAAQSWAQVGLVYLSLGRLDKAVQAYKKALALDPEYALAWYNLGLAYDKQEILDKALSAYKRSLELNSNYAGAWNNIAAIREEQGRLDDAIDAYQKALNTHPKYVRARYNLGCLYFNNGKVEEAIRQLRKVLEIKPDYADAWFKLGDVYAVQGKLGDAARARGQGAKCSRAPRAPIRPRRETEPLRCS